MSMGERCSALQENMACTHRSIAGISAAPSSTDDDGSSADGGTGVDLGAMQSARGWLKKPKATGGLVSAAFALRHSTHLVADGLEAWFHASWFDDTRASKIPFFGRPAECSIAPWRVALYGRDRDLPFGTRCWPAGFIAALECPLQQKRITIRERATN